MGIALCRRQTLKLIADRNHSDGRETERSHTPWSKSLRSGEYPFFSQASTAAGLTLNCTDLAVSWPSVAEGSDTQRWQRPVYDTREPYTCSEEPFRELSVTEHDIMPSINTAMRQQKIWASRCAEGKH
jgi:hypothetical protein